MIRSCIVLLFFGALCCWNRPASAQDCGRDQAAALAADADRASTWNWGWGSLFAASAVAHSGLALWTDDEDRKIALWTGALKSTIGTVYQVINPIRIYRPEADCHDLDAQLARAAEIERKRHGWFPHLSSVAVNMAAFAFVAYETRDYALATSGALLGIAVAEMTIYTAPNEVRSAGLGAPTLQVVPQVASDSVGMQLGGIF